MENHLDPTLYTRRNAEATEYNEVAIDRTVGAQESLSSLQIYYNILSG